MVAATFSDRTAKAAAHKAWLWRSLAVVTIGLVLTRATTVLAQQQDAPLHGVVYPSAVGAVAMPPRTPRVQAPDAGVTVIEPPVQYVVLGGFMGFRDHAGVFHPLRAAASARPPLPGATIGEGARPV